LTAQHNFLAGNNNIVNRTGKTFQRSLDRDLLSPLFIVCFPPEAEKTAATPAKIVLTAIAH